MKIEIVMTLENRKPLPIPWVQLIEFLPTGLLPLSDEGVKRRAYAGGSEIVETTSLAGYERVRFRHKIKAHHRGHYSIGPTELRSGDLFGLFGTVRRDSRSLQGVTVYPRIVPLDGWELPAAKPMGDTLSRNTLLDDPSRPRSIRDYRPGDPMKRIDWKLSAKRDELTVRTYDQSVSNDVVVMMESADGGLRVAWLQVRRFGVGGHGRGINRGEVRRSGLSRRVGGERRTSDARRNGSDHTGRRAASRSDDLGGACICTTAVIDFAGDVGGRSRCTRDH